MERNHYRVLAVAPDATVEEIERSFRQLARRLHPDVNGGDGAAEERMKELNVARTTLTDVASRTAYDERLRREQRARSAPATPSAPAAPSPPDRRPFTTPPSVAAAPRPFAAPTNVSASRPLASSKPRPVTWMGRRDVPPPPATIEIGRFASLGRLFWIGVAALAGLGIVLLLIWLRQALEVAEPGP